MDDALKVGIELIKILQNVHALGVCHGDIKIGNVLIEGQSGHDIILPKTQRNVNEKNQLYLVDFGKAEEYMIRDRDGKYVQRPNDYQYFP